MDLRIWLLIVFVVAMLLGYWVEKACEAITRRRKRRRR